MKALLVCFSVVLSFTQFSRGQSLLSGGGIYEPFDYPANTPLNGHGGWVTTSGRATNVAGNLSMPVGMPDPIGNRVTWGFAVTTSRLPVGTNISGSVYLSFALQVQRVTATGLGFSDTIVGLGVSSAFAPEINFSSNSPSTYQLGIYKGGMVAGALAPTIFSTNDTLFVVARYTFNPGTADDTCDLWLNPDPLSLGGASAPTPTVGNIGAGATDLSEIDNLFIRNGGSEIATMDELRVGTTWASVTPVPEPSGGVLAFAAAGLLFARRGTCGRRFYPLIARS